MRQGIAISLVLVGVLALSVFLIRRHASKKAVLAQPQTVILDASNAVCQVSASATDGYCSALVVQLLPSANAGLPAVRANGEDLSWDHTETVLHDVLKTRINRTVFFRTDARVNPQSKDQMIGLMRRANAERICVIYPEHPPEWYPPRCPGVAGSGNRNLPAAAP
jgi:hypothetical protein